MKILQRYVLRELWIPFAMCFSTLSFIFMAGYLVKAANFIIGRGVPLLETLTVLALAMPPIMSYTAPTSILTAVLIVFGGFSQNNEMRAVKASGVNPLLVMAPALIAGLALSFVMFVFNDQVATRSEFALLRLTKKLLIVHPAAVIEPGRFVKLNDQIVFMAKKVRGEKLEDIIAYETENPAKPIRTILAERGEITSQGTEMKIRLHDGTISDAEGAVVQAIQFKTYEFPTVGQEDLRAMKKKTRDLTLAELLLRSDEPGVSVEDRREIWSWFHQRIAFAFGSFVFVFVGIPVAMLVRRGEIVVSFAISFSALALYYVLFIGANAISVHSVIPAAVAYWMPNLALLGAGGYLFRRSLAV